MKKTILTLAVSVTAVMLLIALNASQRRTAAAELALAESTLAAVAEAASDIEDLALSLDKALLTASPRQAAQYLTQAALTAERSQSALAALPDPYGQQGAVLAWLSRLSHVVQGALADLAEGSGVTGESRTSLNAMRADLSLLQAEFALSSSEVQTGVKAADLAATSVTAPPTAAQLADYKALPSQDVGSGEAMQIAKDFIGADKVRSVAHAPDTGGVMPAWGVTIQTDDLQLNLEITRRGGKVLLMSPETAAFPVRKTVEECREAALAFLQERGFAQMESPWYQVYDGLCVLTCVNVQRGVLIWPDRVTVQVRMDTAEVVGIEARQYWRNHIPRKLQTPLLTASEARAYLSAEPTAGRLCLLPYEGQERLCWQFSIQHEDDTYISYIDAMTGRELRLEKVMHLESGAAPA